MEHTENLKTFEELAGFLAKAGQWLSKSKGNEFMKLGYAISRMIPRVQKALEKEQRKHQVALEKLRIKYCLTDEKGKVLKTPTGEYEFERSKLDLFQDEAEALVEKLYETKIDVKAYYTTDLPAFLLSYDHAFKVQMEPLTGAEMEAFEGVVLREEDAIASLALAVKESGISEDENATMQ